MAKKIKMAALGLFALAANVAGLLPGLTAASASDNEMLSGDVAMCKAQESLCNGGKECCSEICAREDSTGKFRCES